MKKFLPRKHKPVEPQKPPGVISTESSTRQSCSFKAKFPSLALNGFQALLDQLIFPNEISGRIVLKDTMKQVKVVVPWQEGLHLRPAAKLVNTAKSFHSNILLKCGEKVADLRSIVSIISLCATMGMALDVVAWGEDARDATQAIAQVFSAHGADAGETVISK